jgi:hypothetical protein
MPIGKVAVYLALLLVAPPAPLAWAGPDAGAFLCHITHLSNPRDERLRRMQLVDAFESVTAVTRQMHHYCNAASIDGAEIGNPDVHYLTYLFQQSPAHRPVNGLVADDLFGSVTMSAREPQLLMIPASGPDGRVAPANPYKCYRLDFDGFGKNPLVYVEDAFTTPPKLIKVRKPRFLCNPVDIDGKGIREPAPQLTCYRHVAKRPAPDDVPVRNLGVADDLGERDLDAGKDDLLCVPTVITQP